LFQPYFETGKLFETSSSNISWIGSIQSFLLQLTGIIAGPLYDRGYLRFLLCTGSLLVVLGLMMLSLCTEYWQALLAQAFCLGIGAGLLFVPTVSLIPTWFSTRVVLAIFLGQTVILLYVSFYPENRHLTDRSLAFYIATIFNAGLTLGCILPNAMSDHIGVFNTVVPLTLALGAILFCI
ncbi:uncharacterized protein P884DRAFT_200139, partial [Thermothelomyces heterothallicus CBS 202.75]|uniref:uncharacterized protein n=1 Tax=Thermothelomyces heterothallicus CBS 202.75 TaxID=1149848 RepID=UPI003743448A